MRWRWNLIYIIEMKTVLVSKKTIKILLGVFYIKHKACNCSKNPNEIILFWINERLSWELLRRKKGQKLWKSHKDYISVILNKFTDHQDAIWRAYHLSNITKLKLLKSLQKKSSEDRHFEGIINSCQNISLQAQTMIKAVMSLPQEL